MSPAAQPRALPELAVSIMDGLYQHRLLSSAQVHTLYAPHASRHWTNQILNRLAHTGLAQVAHGERRLGLWFLTERGAAAVETIPTRAEPRRKLTTPEQAIGPLRHHTIAVNDVGIAFVQAARQRGDDCGPASWRHEIAHPLGPPPGQRASEQLIADALLTYQLNEPDGPSFHYRLIELDRDTMPADALADKLARYARLYHHTVTPANPLDEPQSLWASRYAVFPGVMVALAGSARGRLERRREIVLGLCRGEHSLTSTPEVEIAVCLLDDLRTHGPFAPIFQAPARKGAQLDWLLQDTASPS